MKKRIFKKSINTIISMFFLIIIYCLVSSVIEHIKFNDDLNEFIGKSEFNETLSTETTKYYEVKRESWMRDKPILNLNSKSVGYNGDILLTRDSPLMIPIIDDGVNMLFGGHAAIITDEGYQQIEAQGRDPHGDNYVRKVFNEWYNYDGETIALRMRNVSERVYENAVIEAEKIVLKKIPYNYTFLFNTKKSFYCTDLLSYIYGKQNINLNPDLFATSTYDLLVNKNTYISYYSYTDSKDIKHIYYTV